MFHGNRNFKKKLFLLKYLINFKLSKYFNEQTFFAKINFSSKFAFFFRNKGKNFYKTIFSKISKQVDENLIMPSGER